MRWPRKRRIGLALGGGAARGWAHLGVLRAIQERQVDIQFVAGTSIGSLVGGFYVAGCLPDLEKMALGLNWKQVLYYFFDVGFPRSGIVDGKRIVDEGLKHLKQRKIEDLPIPYRAVATDVLTGDEVVFSEGDLMQAIRASIAIPGVFTPVPMGAWALVDGGLVNPVPVNVVRQMGADYVIAVDITHDVIGRQQHSPSQRDKKIERPSAKAWPFLEHHPVYQNLREQIRRVDDKVDVLLKRLRIKGDLPHIFDVLGNSIRIVESQIADMRLKIDKPDLLIRPEVGRYSFMEFHKAQEIMELGYVAASAALADVK